MAKITAFIDADILLYRAASFCDDEFDGEPMRDVRQAMTMFDMLLKKWLKDVEKAVKLDDYFLVVSKGRTFRKDLYPEYKANRKDIKPHPVLFPLKDEVMELQATIWEDDMEADDLIGIRVTEDPSMRLAVSADKDFATLPCQLFTPASHGKTQGSLTSYNEDEANWNWLIQAMTGDTIDNYKGIPGVGPKKAAKVIPAPAPLDVMWPAVERAFIDAKMTKDDALTMARLARILRHGDYNFETKETKLWTPSR
ncbi:hypothetical protein Q9295_10060 [Xinfangfangia sp. CPCC 101601]|uniref:5'-3' exonuclease domain-containing protein n=1 Tax=Pseudogemmobacter lacusdianii TaxID=3069608 RepID=A0ABU0VYA1_9RHOB|nr:hypothetical protein [Xinfangfangia sp. CPCC 101601]MDQ2066721.1 hypothetical protein [Xinfangfangia sp. CPCC 101601]